MQNRKRDTDVQNRLLDSGRRRGWDVLREQHWNKYTIKGETDHQPRLDTWDKCSGLVHWEDPEGMGWRGRREGVSGWGTHVNPWLIHVNVWQKPLQYCNYPPTNKNKWKKKSMVDKLWSQAVYAELKLTGWLKEIGKLTIVIWDMTIFYSETDKWRR